MSHKKYRVRLSAAQRELLAGLTSKGTIKVRAFKRAWVLLLADEANDNQAKPDEQIAEQVNLCVATVGRVRRRFVQDGLEAALTDKPRPGAPPKFKGSHRAAVTALACSDPPEGYARWSLRLLADKLVELEYLESICHKSVGQILKKTNLSPT